MKCIQCDIDNNLKDRDSNAGCCKNCGHPFAFEPTEIKPIAFTDLFFEQVLSTLSVDNTLFFTQEQFFYFLERQLRRKIVGSWMAWIAWIISGMRWAISGVAIAFSCILSLQLETGTESATIALFWVYGVPATIFSLWQRTKSPNISFKWHKFSARLLIFFGICLIITAVFFLFNSSTTIIFLQFVLSTIFGILSIYLGIIQEQRAKKMVQTLIIKPDRAEEWLTRWIEVNGAPEKLLFLPQEEQTPAEISDEISRYSFDRALICDSDEIAQFLIANNFHFEHNCAVLSVTGYPQNIFATVMQMLRRNPDLKVFSLHNATPQGVLLPHTLRSQSEWFAETTALVYDLGITPKQILKQPGISVFRSENLVQEAQNLPSEIKKQLSAEEMEWLEAGNYVELAVFSPEKLLRIVTRGIADTRISDRELSKSEDSGNWENEDSSYLYTSDSFG